jgi:hypothetical protein
LYITFFNVLSALSRNYALDPYMRPIWMMMPRIFGLAVFYVKLAFMAIMLWIAWNERHEPKFHEIERMFRGHPDRRLGWLPCVTSSTMSCFYPANWDAAPSAFIFTRTASTTTFTAFGLNLLQRFS